MVPPNVPPLACIRVLTSSMGCVKLTAKAAARPPHPIDSSRFGLRAVDIISIIVDLQWSAGRRGEKNDAWNGESRWAEAALRF